MTNCPNCGAPVNSYKCDYCGTVFDENNLEYKVVLYADNIAVETLYKNALNAIRSYDPYARKENV